MSNAVEEVRQTALTATRLVVEEILTETPISLWKDAWRRLIKNRASIAGGIFLLLISLTAIFAPFVAPYPYDQQDLVGNYQSPSSQHLLGTDGLGRDLLSRMIYGARISLSVGIIASLVGLVIGITYGSISGYAGGRVDNLMMRFVDVMYAFPDLLFIILIMVIFGRGIFVIYIALGVTAWMTIARLVRGQILSLREKEFIEAARAVGAGMPRIILRHLLPNFISPVIVAVTLNIPNMIMAESTLSFIGLGVPPPMASWGVLANEGWRAMRSYPHLVLFPGVVIALTMLAFNFLGDGLRDALDPRMR